MINKCATPETDSYSNRGFLFFFIPINNYLMSSIITIPPVTLQPTDIIPLDNRL